MPTSTEPTKGRDILRSPITTIFASTVLSCGSSQAQSSTFIADGYRNATAYITVSDTGSTAAATTLQVVPQFSPDTGANWFDYREGIWASMVFGAAQLQDSTFRRSHSLQLDGRRFRFSVERNTTVDSINFTAAIDFEAKD